VLVKDQSVWCCWRRHRFMRSFWRVSMARGLR